MALHVRLAETPPRLPRTGTPVKKRALVPTIPKRWVVIQGCMNGIPEATPIILTEAERTELEALARSTKTEYRLRQRAWIVLGAAEGVASRAIGREVGCTTGTASKWRVRYAANRLAGLDETGNRGAKPKYPAKTDKRILAVLDGPVPAGYARWTGPLIAAALCDVDVQYVWRFELERSRPERP
jgi:transposase